MMRDPERLHRGTEPVAAALLNAGRADAPSRDTLHRMMSGASALGIGLGTKLSSAALVAGKSSTLPSSGASLALKWVSIGFLAGTAVVAGAAAVSLPAPETRSATSAITPANKSESKASAARREPQVAALQKTPQAATSAPRAHANARPAPLPESGPSLQTASSDPHMASTLREEVAVLSRAKAALDQGAPSEALDAIRTYHMRFPSGHMRREAVYLEMESEHALDHRHRSMELARLLASGASQSARRAREILDGGRQ